jgi:predicted nucleic acid-binding protein
MPAAGARRYYVDTSAYLCVLLAEEGADALEKDFAGAELLSSVLLVLEANRNLVRLARAGALTADRFRSCVERLHKDRDEFALRDLTLDLCESSAMPPVKTPRSLDLAHLRTAAWFHAQEPLTRFVTTDADQAQSARELGLPI